MQLAGGIPISEKKVGTIADVINSPYIDLIAYNLSQGVAPQTIERTLKCVFGGTDTRYQITNLRELFFNDVECVRGKKFIFKIEDSSTEDLLPFSKEEILNRRIGSLPLQLTTTITKKLKNGDKLDPTEAQLLMNILNYKLKSKEIKQIPLLEDYIDPTKEDMIFEGVEYDE